jgi:MFS family permease
VVSSNSALPNPGIFYGWLVVAAAFVVTFVGFGSAYTFSAFFGSLQQDFTASRGSVSLVFSLAGFLYFGLGAVTGPLADRWGSRRLAVIGMILTGVGLAVASAARSLPEVYAAYGLGVGLGVGCSYVPAVGAVQRWFARRRGFASGLAVSGIGVGTLVMPPLASILIEALGWRNAYLVPYALDHGASQSSAVLLLGVIGVGSTAGRFVLGGLADRLGRRLALLAMFVGMGLALVVWAFSTALWTLAAFAFGYGVFYGGFVALLPALVMDYFGGRNVSGIIGILYTSVAFGTLVGPSAAGFAFDLSHSYTLPILASVCANIIAAGVVWVTSKSA